MKDHDADQTNAFIPQCFFCGGEVKSITVGNFDYRLEGQLFVIKGTPAGLCLRCGEKYVTAATAKRINALIESGRFTGAEQVRVMQYDQAPMKGLYADGT